MRYAAAIWCLLSVTACDLWSPTEPSPINAEITLAPGEVRNVNGADLAITFEQVVGDNRCPGDAICITGGSATIRILVQGPGSVSRRYDLTTGEMRPVEHRGVRVELLEVTPYPFASMPFDPSEYRVRLRIVR
jgi:hypothetical protein